MLNCSAQRLSLVENLIQRLTKKKKKLTGNLGLWVVRAYDRYTPSGVSVCVCVLGNRWQWPLLGCYRAIALGKQLGYWGMACKLRPSTQASMSLWLGRQKWQWAATAPESVKRSAGPLRALSSGECSNSVSDLQPCTEHEARKLSRQIKMKDTQQRRAENGRKKVKKKKH